MKKFYKINEDYVVLPAVDGKWSGLPGSSRYYVFFDVAIRLEGLSPNLDEDAKVRTKKNVVLGRFNENDRINSLDSIIPYSAYVASACKSCGYNGTDKLEPGVYYEIDTKKNIVLGIYLLVEENEKEACKDKLTS